MSASTTGRPMSGWGCAPCCGNPLEVNFKGSFIGVIPTKKGAYVTRIPEIMQNESWTQDYTVTREDGQQYVDWRPDVIHPNQRVFIEDIDYNGTIMRCIGMAGSQYGDTSYSRPLGAGRMWVQLQFAPLEKLKSCNVINDIDADDIVSGFCVIDVFNIDVDQTVEPEKTIFRLNDVWLITDRKWDKLSEICNYWQCDEDGASKVCVGDTQFCIFERRVNGGSNNKFTIYGIGSATPSTITFHNGEADQADSGGFFAAYVDYQAFPMALGHRATDGENFRGEPVIKVRSIVGVCNTSTGKIETDDPETRWYGDVGGSGGSGTFGDGLGPGYYSTDISELNNGNDGLPYFFGREFISDWISDGCWLESYGEPPFEGADAPPYYLTNVLLEDNFGFPEGQLQPISSGDDFQGLFRSWSGISALNSFVYQTGPAPDFNRSVQRRAIGRWQDNSSQVGTDQDQSGYVTQGSSSSSSARPSWLRVFKPASNVSTFAYDVHSAQVGIGVFMLDAGKNSTNPFIPTEKDNLGGPFDVGMGYFRDYFYGVTLMGNVEYDSRRVVCFPFHLNIHTTYNFDISGDPSETLSGVALLEQLRVSMINFPAPLITQDQLDNPFILYPTFVIEPQGGWYNSAAPIVKSLNRCQKLALEIAQDSSGQAFPPAWRSTFNPPGPEVEEWAQCFNQNCDSDTQEFVDPTGGLTLLTECTRWTGTNFIPKKLLQEIGLTDTEDDNFGNWHKDAFRFDFDINPNNISLPTATDWFRSGSKSINDYRWSPLILKDTESGAKRHGRKPYSFFFDSENDDKVTEGLPGVLNKTNQWSYSPSSVASLRST